MEDVGLHLVLCIGVGKGIWSRDRGGWMGCGMWDSHTRLLCWTASGTRGVISRESSCFVGAILAGLLSFYSLACCS